MKLTRMRKIVGIVACCGLSVFLVSYVFAAFEKYEEKSDYIEEDDTDHGNDSITDPDAAIGDDEDDDEAGNGDDDDVDESSDPDCGKELGTVTYC